jgi:hypothetical protein
MAIHFDPNFPFDRSLVVKNDDNYMAWCLPRRMYQLGVLHRLMVILFKTRPVCSVGLSVIYGYYLTILLLLSF